ncbi:MAG: hypothetical protein NXY57DRAFT_967139 [Lentinula lateritia]|nr:MAG: hypothetical protein NXY57DRAFT_967139 [Lentinula lateritia]
MHTTRSRSSSIAVHWRQRLSPSHTILGPPLNGDGMMKYLSANVWGTTLGLYFALGDAIPQRKGFDSTLSRFGHKRSIDVQSGFGDNTDGDDLYKAKVIVGAHKFHIAGTYDQSSSNTNACLSSYGCTEMFKGDVAILFYSVHAPEQFLHSIPHYQTIQARDEVIRRAPTAFSKNVREHVEKGTTLKHILRG